MEGHRIHILLFTFFTCGHSTNLWRDGRQLRLSHRFQLLVQDVFLEFERNLLVRQGVAEVPISHSLPTQHLQKLFSASHVLVLALIKLHIAQMLGVFHLICYRGSQQSSFASRSHPITQAIVVSPLVLEFSRFWTGHLGRSSEYRTIRFLVIM